MSQYLIGVAFAVSFVVAFVATERLIFALPAGFVAFVVWYVSPLPNHNMPNVTGKGEYWGIRGRDNQ